MKNFQVLYLSRDNVESKVDNNDLNIAIERLKSCPVVGVVDRLDESLVVAEEILRNDFPKIDLYPQHDPLKRELRFRIAPERQDLYDLFVTPTTDPAPNEDDCVAVARSLADAVRRAEPLLDPGRHLSRVRAPVTLIHGRGDRLVPYTESLRFHECLPESIESDVTITGLFGHTADSAPGSLSSRVRESVLFLQAMRRVLNTV